jgi:cytochrome bd-type quinol oxidase subunit 2
MRDILANLTLAELTAWVVVVALNAYVLSGGADFGGGVWDLLATGPRRQQQRRLIAKAIGPIWEANHVWLIVVVVVLFVCFPPAFAAFGTVLHIPLSIMLVGIVLRGSAFIFRSYSYGPRSEQRRLGRVFAASSLITPVVLGMCVGAVVSGNVGGALANLDIGPAAALPPASRGPTNTSEGFAALYVNPWISPFTIAVGAMVLALFSFLAATYLTVEAEGDAELQDDFRRRALGASAAAMVAALIALGVRCGTRRRHGADRRRGMVAATPGWFGRGGRRCSDRAPPATVPIRTHRRRRLGDADPVGVGARAVPTDDSAEPDHRRRRGAAEDDRGQPQRPGWWRGNPRAVAVVSDAGVQDG